MKDARRLHEVRIGTSGWNYPPSGYGTWTGVFYPFKQNQAVPGEQRKFDELAYYAERFDTVEINNTFYRPPAPRTAQSWVTRTPEGFEFSLKLFRQFTHQREVTRADVDTFRRGLEPLADEPLCECGARLRPDIVWFGEMLPPGVWEAAALAARACDLFLVVGTSAVVHPAASLVPIAVRSHPSAKVIEINLARTEASSLADIGLYGPSGVVLPKLVERLDEPGA